MSEHRTEDVTYGEPYWATLDGGAGYKDSLLWIDLSHIIHEVVGVDKVAGVDRALETRLLDVGCAYGYFLLHMRERGYDVRGIDYSEYALSQAPASLETYLSFFDLTADVNLSEWYRPFDVVTCFETLEHIPVGSAEKAVRHLWDALKPGGLVIATICTVGHPDPSSDPTHCTIVPREWWEDVFTDVGFTLEPEIARQLRWFWLFSQHRGVLVARRPC